MGTTYQYIGQPVIKSKGSHTFSTLHCECLHVVFNKNMNTYNCLFGINTLLCVSLILLFTLYIFFNVYVYFIGMTVAPVIIISYLWRAGPVHVFFACIFWVHYFIKDMVAMITS